MTTFLLKTLRRFRLSNLGLSILHASLTLARRIRLIRDFALDDQGLWNGLLIEAYSPRYDNPASGLPRFARWKANGSWFFKLGGMTVIIEL